VKYAQIQISSVITHTLAQLILTIPTFVRCLAYRVCKLVVSTDLSHI